MVALLSRAKSWLCKGAAKIEKNQWKNAEARMKSGRRGKIFSRTTYCLGDWAKKRPSVETEGRLTIACHMKNLQKIDVGVSLSSIRLCPVAASGHKDNDQEIL